MEKMRDKHEFSLDNRELALVFAAFLLLLVLSFALGIMAGRGMKGVVMVQQPLAAVAPPLSGETASGGAVAAIPAAGSGHTAGTGAQTSPGPSQFTFYTSLTTSGAEGGKPASPPPMEKPKPPVPEKTKPPSGAPGGKGGRFSIQISSSQEKQQSMRRVEDMKKKGYPAYLEDVDIKGKGTWYRVKVGRFGTRDEAVKYAQSLKRKEKLSSFVIVAGE